MPGSPPKVEYANSVVGPNRRESASRLTIITTLVSTEECCVPDATGRCLEAAEMIRSSTSGLHNISEAHCPSTRALSFEGTSGVEAVHPVN